MRPSPADIFASARYYLYGLDLANGRADVLDVARSFYAASFLDQRALSGTRVGGWHYGLDELLDAHAQPGRIAREPDANRNSRWIFHVGHCGSTLLSRLLDQLPDVLGVREPLPLLALAEAWLRRDDPPNGAASRRIDATLALVADLLARGYAAKDRVVVKATSTASMLAPALLASRTADRAILLELPLSRYLAAYLRDPALRAQARADAVPRLAAWRAWTQDDALSLHQLDDAQCIALSWLVETERFERLARDPETAARVLRVDGDALLAQPAEHLERIAQHFRLDASDTELESAIASGVLQRYAKQTDRHYDHAARARDLADAESRFAREIEGAGVWARKLASAFKRFSGRPNADCGGSACP